MSSARRWDGVSREPKDPVDPEVRRRAREWRNQTAGQARLHQLRAIARAPASGRPRRGRRRLDGQLRSRRARRHRRWRRPLAQTQTCRPWTLWTTLRVAHIHSLPSSNDRPERNENRVTHVVGQILLPMFPVAHAEGAVEGARRASAGVRASMGASAGRRLLKNTARSQASMRTAAAMTA